MEWSEWISGSINLIEKLNVIVCLSLAEQLSSVIEPQFSFLPAVDGHAGGGSVVVGRLSLALSLPPRAALTASSGHPPQLPRHSQGLLCGMEKTKVEIENDTLALPLFHFNLKLITRMYSCPLPCKIFQESGELRYCKILWKEFRF